MSKAETAPKRYEPRMRRRSSLDAQLSKFEKTIAENARHAPGCKSFLTNVVSSPSVRHNRKKTIAIAEEPTVSSTTNESEASITSTPGKLCVRLCYDDMDDKSIESTELNIYRLTEDDAVSTISTLSYLLPEGLKVTKKGDTDLEPTQSDEDSLTEQSVSGRDLEDMYDASRMLVDWEYQASVIKRRAALERKGMVDIGSPVKLKDRMKAFSTNTADSPKESVKSLKKPVPRNLTFNKSGCDEELRCLVAKLDRL